MDPDDKIEMEALVLGFLTQSLRDNPDGFTLREFERLFPEKTDEPLDWYKRYKMKNTADALECIQDVVKLGYDNRRNSVIISLNRRSDKLDTHLVDLVTNQRSSSKKRRGYPSRPSSRALASFNLNKPRYPSNFRPSNLRSRINSDQRRESPPAVSQFERQPFRPSIYTKAANSAPSKMPPNDPRRGAMVPPQVRPTSHSSQFPIPKPKETSSIRPYQNTSYSKTFLKPVIAESAQPKQPSKEEDPTILKKKHHVRQRIVSLLTRKLPEIKLMHLRSLYELEYDEKLDTLELGHNNFTALLQDPILSEFIQIGYASGFVTISVRDKIKTQGKENISSNNLTKHTNTVESNGFNVNCRTNGQGSVISYSKAKLEAIDPFNVKTMLKTLEPMGAVTEPPLKNLEIDENIKYITMRMIFKSPDPLKLDDWESLFEAETRCKIPIRDYGCKTVLDFFRKLEKELPMKIEQRNGQWVAIRDIYSMSSWVNSKLSNGLYRVATAIDQKYESIAFPNDTYTFAQNIEDLKAMEFQPVFILSAKLSCAVRVQLRTPKRIEEHLCVEAAMNCYDYYKENNMLVVPHSSFLRNGFPCAVFDDKQQRWCRALIIHTPEKKVDRNLDVKALLVDYGIERNYPVSKLICLLKAQLKLPVGPIYSILYGIERKTSLTVQKHVMSTLQEFTAPPVTLACKFLRAVPSGEEDYLPKNYFEITLLDTRHGRDCNLADIINLSQGQEGDN